MSPLFWAILLLLVGLLIVGLELFIPSSGLLGLVAPDIRHWNGVFRQDSAAGAGDFGEAALDENAVRHLAALEHRNDPRPDGGNQPRMAGQDAKVAFEKSAREVGIELFDETRIVLCEFDSRVLNTFIERLNGGVKSFRGC